jgi:hypothetical protein
MIHVTPVILCGGSGSRLWPLSRSGFPKQFLCLTGDLSLFQQAAQRMVALGNEIIKVSDSLIVSREDHRFLAAEQLREVGIGLGTALLEPSGHNTAPALTLAAFAALQNGQDPVLVVTPADQTIGYPSAFTSDGVTIDLTNRILTLPFDSFLQFHVYIEACHNGLHELAVASYKAAPANLPSLMQNMAALDAYRVKNLEPIFKAVNSIKQQARANGIPSILP